MILVPFAHTQTHANKDVPPVVIINKKNITKTQLIVFHVDSSLFSASASLVGANKINRESLLYSYANTLLSLFSF